MSSELGTFGKYLMTERELRGVSLDEIATSTKIKLEYLVAIENDRFCDLPNETFIKGYIRAYAKFCGLNEDEVLVNYEFFAQKIEGNCNENSQPAESEDVTAMGYRKYLLIGLLVAALIICAAAWYLSFFHFPGQ